MATISQIRQQYPDYNDLSDQQLADSLYNAHYSDMPKDQFYQKIGFNAANNPNVNSGTTLSNTFNPLMNYYKGFAHAVGSTGADVANLIPGVNVQMPQLGSGTAYNLGNVGGNIGAFMAGGEGLDVLLGALAAKDLPIVSKAASLIGGEGLNPLAQTLTGVGRRAVGTGAYGGLTNPNDPTSGAVKGTAASLITDAFGNLGEGLVKGIQYAQPQQLSDQIVGALGNGKSLEENAQSVAQDVKDSYKARRDEATDLYNKATQSFGTQNIYPASPQGSTLGLFQQLKGAYPDVSKTLSDNFPSDLKELHDNFLDDPTFNNAHELRKQLNSEISQYYKPGQTLDKDGRDSLSALQNSKAALDTDINSFTNQQPPDIANQYRTANQYFADNVAPYRDNRQIFKMAQGDITNPKNLASIFRSPEPEVQKVVSDLPDDAKDRVVYSMLGKTNATKSPENLMTAFNGLDQQGLGSYVSPTLRDQINQLGSKIKARSTLQALGGGAATLGLLHPFHFIPGEVSGGLALGAGAASPFVSAALQKFLPKTNLPALAMNAVGSAYRPLANSLMANLIPGGSQ